ncbi:MAG: Hsp70 family protein, partial [Myxococcota bacterium]
DIAALEGGDEDAGQRARRALLDVESELVEVDAQQLWPELEEELEEQIAISISWVSEFGTDAERGQLEHAIEAAERARSRKSVSETQRRLRMLRALSNAAYFRSPESWPSEFEFSASRIDVATNLPEAERLVREGRAFLESGNIDALKGVVRKLWDLLPPTDRERRETHGSGVR